LDTYSDSAVALVGCRSAGISREACEFDVVLVGDEPGTPASLRVGEEFFDIMFLKEKEALKPGDPELALSLSGARTIRDVSLVLSTATTACRAVAGQSAKVAAELRLSSSLKSMGRAEEALAAGGLADADLWLLTSSYGFGRSWLLSLGVLPSPSHLVKQLRENSRGGSRSFEAFSRGAGLEMASRADSLLRLEAVSVLSDAISSRASEAGESSLSSESVALEIVKSKAGALSAGLEPAECHSFLGMQLVTRVLNLARLEARGLNGAPPTFPVQALQESGSGLMGKRLVKELGLARDKRTLVESVALLKQQMSRLAKRI